MVPAALRPAGGRHLVRGAVVALRCAEERRSRFPLPPVLLPRRHVCREPRARLGRGAEGGCPAPPAQHRRGAGGDPRGFSRLHLRGSGADMAGFPPHPALSARGASRAAAALQAASPRAGRARRPLDQRRAGV